MITLNLRNCYTNLNLFWYFHTVNQIKILQAANIAYFFPPLEVHVKIFKMFQKLNNESCLMELILNLEPFFPIASYLKTDTSKQLHNTRTSTTSCNIPTKNLNDSPAPFSLILNQILSLNMHSQILSWLRHSWLSKHKIDTIKGIWKSLPYLKIFQTSKNVASHTYKQNLEEK